MLKKKIKMQDKDISVLIGHTLRWGVFLSLGIAVAGGIFYLIRHGGEPNKFIGQTFQEKDLNIALLLNDTLKGVLHLRGYYIIFLGIILLLSTPFLRVLLSFIAFILEKDRLYVVITAIVLAIIVGSILSGFGG